MIVMLNSILPISFDAVSNVLSVANNASLPASGNAGGKMSHAYTYDGLYRLVSATGIYTGADSKSASYTLAMGYDNMHRITSKSQHLTQDNVQFNGTLNVGYDLTYTYGTEDGKKFQLASVKDVNYRTEETPGDNKIENNHVYLYDKNGNLVYVNTGRLMNDGHNETGTGERKLIWDEENRLLAVDDNGFVSNYWYDADGERTVKTSGESDQVYVNGVFSGGSTNTAKFSLYVSPYLVANQGGRYTKHIYAGSQRIVSKIGDFASYGSDPRRIEYAGANTDGLSVDYKAKYAAQQQVIRDNYKTFDVPYNGTDNDNYADGEGFCCNDGSMEAAVAEARKAQARAVARSFKDPDNYENLQFFYHPDHLGSSSFITNLEGEVVQHIEYVPFGEVFIEERNNVWNTPYLFNAKEFDEETGMYYYGARYYDPRLSLWISTDPKEEIYSNISSYCYVANNPITISDPNGMELKVVSSEALNVLAHTLHPEDRQYLQLNENGYIDSQLLNRGVQSSKSGSENLNYLSEIVNSSQDVVFFGAVNGYDYYDSHDKLVKSYEFEPAMVDNELQSLMSEFSGTPEQRAKYENHLKSMGFKDEVEVTGNLGVTLQSPLSQSEFPTQKVSTSSSVEVYLNAKNTPLLDQAKTAAHELYGHALFGIKGLDSRHGGSSGSLSGNIPLENRINQVENEVLKNNQ